MPIVVQEGCICRDHMAMGRSEPTIPKKEIGSKLRQSSDCQGLGRTPWRTGQTNQWRHLHFRILEAMPWTKYHLAVTKYQEGWWLPMADRGAGNIKSMGFTSTK